MCGCVVDSVCVHVFACDKSEFCRDPEIICHGGEEIQQREDCEVVSYLDFH